MSPTTQEGKFVGRFEEAVMQFVVLEKAMQNNEVTRENLESTFKGNLEMKYNHLDTCLDTLVKEEHLTKDGNKYRITDDGREDVQQVQRLALEMQNIVKQTGGTQTQTGSSQTGTSQTGNR